MSKSPGGDTNALLAFLHEQRRWINARYEEAQARIQSSSDKDRALRTFFLTGATFLIPLLLGLIPLNVLTVAQGENFSIIVAIAIGLVSLGLSIDEARNNGRSTRLRREFSPLGYAMDVYINANASELAARESDDNDEIVRELYGASTIIFTAIIYELLLKAQEFLDENTRKLLQKHIYYMCDNSIEWWKYLATDRLKKILETNDTLANALSSYRKYCDSIRKRKR